MKLCMLCGNPTEGSIGAAGIPWSFICQPCKDDEDKALAQQIQAQAKVMDSVMNAIMNPNKTKLPID